MKEGVSINKLDAKSEKLTFVGFLDGLRAVRFYDARARSVKTSHNFRFLKDPVSTPEHLPTLSDGMPREGESRPGDVDKAGSAPDTADRIESRMEWIRVSKRKNPCHKDLGSSLGEVNEEDLSQTKDFNEGVRHGDPHVSSKASVTPPLPLPSSV